MNLKKRWKNWPYYLKGTIIAGAIWLFISIMVFIIGYFELLTGEEYVNFYYETILITSNIVALVFISMFICWIIENLKNGFKKNQK